MEKNNFYILLVCLLFCIKNYAQLSYTVKHYDLNDGLPSSCIYDIEQDKNGFMLFATEAGLIKYDGNNFTKPIINKQFPDNIVLSCVTDSSNNYYLGLFNSGLYQFNQSIPNFYSIGNNNKSSVKSISIVSNKLCYYDISMSTFFIKNIYNRKLNIFDSICVKNTIFNDFVLKNNELIIATKVGLIVKNLKTKKKVWFFYGKNVSNIVNYNNRFYITINNKLYVLNSNFVVEKESDLLNNSEAIGKFCVKNIETFFYTSIKTDKLYQFINGSISSFENVNTQNSQVTDLFLIQNNLWISTYSSGLFKIELNGFTNVLTSKKYCTKLLIDKKLMFIGTNLGLFLKNLELNKIYSLSKNNVFGINKLKENYFIVSNINNIIDLKLDTIHLKFIDARGCYKKENDIIFTYPWSKTITVLDEKGNQFKKYDFQYKGKVNFISSYNKSDYIVASHHGIFIFDTLVGYKKGLDTTTRYNCGLKVSDGTFIFGGIGKLSVLKNNKIKTIDLSNYINEVKCLAFDNTNKLLLIGTSDGLLYYNLKSNQLKKINFPFEEYGNMINDIVLQDTIIFLASNKITFASKYPALFFEQKQHYNLVFENYKSNVKTIYFPNDEIELSSSERNVELKINKPNYDLFNKAKYKYSINFQKLNNLPSDGSIILNELKYGENTIYVFVQTDGVNWVLEKTILLNKAYPFYYKWWFIALYISIGLLLVYLFFKFQLQKRTSKLIELQKTQAILTEYKFKSIGNNTNTHFLSNALTSIQQYILQGDSLQASDYLAKVSRLQRLILNAVQKQTHSIEDEFNITQKYLELEFLRFGQKIEVIIVGNILDKNKSILVPPLILQPIIENAFKHAFVKSDQVKKQIVIRIVNGEDSISISIEDNGVGFNNINFEKDILNSTSYGLKSVIERLSLNKKYSVVILSKPILENGCKIQLTFKR